MIGSSGNSGGVVVGALVCGTECNGFTVESRVMLRFSLIEIYLSSRRISVHNEIQIKVHGHDYLYLIRNSL